MFYVREEFCSRLYRVSSGFQKSFLKVLLGFIKPFAKHIVLVARRAYCCASIPLCRVVCIPCA